MAAVPGIRPPKLSPFWGGFYIFFSLFISIIFGKSPCAVGRAGGGGVGGLITWHNWRSTLLVAVVLGIRLPNYSIFFWGGGSGMGGGGLGWEGEKILFPCVSICIASLCLSMPDCDTDFALSISACL